MNRKILSLVFVLIVPFGYAATDTWQFDSDRQRARFYALIDELRCPKCQNQNLADSNAPIAEDLRAEVYRLIREGKSDSAVKSYLVDRYGQYVLYRPPLTANTWLLWSAPVLLLIIGIVAVLLLVRRRRAETTGSQTLTPQEQEKLAHLLGESGEPQDKQNRQRGQE